MFWDTEAMSRAVAVAEKQLGDIANYLPLKDAKYSGVRLYTKDAGVFWYGDIDYPKDKGKLNRIASSLKTEVFVLPNDTDMKYTLESQALISFVPKKS